MVDRETKTHTERHTNRQTDRRLSRHTSSVAASVGRTTVSPGSTYLWRPHTTDVINARLTHAPETLCDVMTVT